MTERKWALAFAEEMGIEKKNGHSNEIDLTFEKEEKEIFDYINDLFELKIDHRLSIVYSHYVFDNEDGKEIRIMTRYEK